MTATVHILSHVSLQVSGSGGVRRALKRVQTMFNALGRDGKVSSVNWLYASAGCQPKILRRSDFLKMLALPKTPMEQTVCLLGMRQGFRSGEILAAKHSHFDLDEGIVYVADTKDKKLYPLPLHRETAFAYVGIGDKSGYVLKHAKRFQKFRGRPLSFVGLHSIIHRWAYNAGVKTPTEFNPTLLRAFFAKEWARRQGDIVLLSKVMRHRDPFTTWVYLQKYVYVEDLRREMENVAEPLKNKFMVEEVENGE